MTLSLWCGDTNIEFLLICNEYVFLLVVLLGIDAAWKWAVLLMLQSNMLPPSSGLML